MKFGYARVSTNAQELGIQLEELKKAGCEKFFSEKVSGVKQKRPQFENLLEYLREGDVVVVVALDRLARSMTELTRIMGIFKEKGVQLQSLREGVFDTTGAFGNFIFQLFSALAEFERNLIVERTRKGYESARARGKAGGRPKGLSKEAKQKAALAKQMYLLKGEDQMSIDDICKQLSISKPTLYRYLHLQNVPVGDYRKQDEMNADEEE